LLKLNFGGKLTSKAPLKPTSLKGLKTTCNKGKAASSIKNPKVILMAFLGIFVIRNLQIKVNLILSNNVSIDLLSFVD
jgi:hypothetical protein